MSFFPSFFDASRGLVPDVALPTSIHSLKDVGKIVALDTSAEGRWLFAGKLKSVSSNGPFVHRVESD